MQKPTRLTLRRQIRHIQECFFQIGKIPFTDILSADLSRRISILEKTEKMTKSRLTQSGHFRVSQTSPVSGFTDTIPVALPGTSSGLY